MLTRRALLAAVWADAVRLPAAEKAVTPLPYQELPPLVRQELQHHGLTEVDWPEWRRQLSENAERRAHEGRWDEVIFYLLQSREFTAEPAIEPALSARDYFNILDPPERRCFTTPDQPCPLHTEPTTNVRRRMADLLNPPRRVSPQSERWRYISSLVNMQLENGVRVTKGQLEGEYRRVMRALYQKEFELSPTALGKFYESRGLSTDTQVAASYAVSLGLSVLHALDPAFHAGRTLILGPGLDLAPRTQLYDQFPPQSFQPYLVADALRRSGLAEQPEIRCWDISEPVVRFITAFPQGSRELRVYSTPGDAEYNHYFAAIGRTIGRVVEEPSSAGLLLRRLQVDPSVAKSVTAQVVNVLGWREEAARSYDLAVATNVLLYFQGNELLVALANITRQLRSGGYFLFNDTRPEVERLLGLAGLRPRQARIVRLGGTASHPLTDAFVLFQKE